LTGQRAVKWQGIYLLGIPILREMRKARRIKRANKELKRVE
jgi:hypothetical protein